MKLSESQVIQFHDQGYLRLEGVLDPEEDLQPVIKAYEEVIEERAQQLYAKGLLSSLYADEPFHRRIASIAAEAPEVGQDELGAKRLGLPRFGGHWMIRRPWFPSLLPGESVRTARG